MKTRLYVGNDYDYDYIVNALLSENLTKEDMTFQTDETFITDIGFFSYRIEHGYPRLVHFFLDKDKRSLKNAHSLIRTFKKIMIGRGYLFFIAFASKNKKYLNRFIKYMKGIKYEENNGNTYYYVPLFGRVV